MIEYELVEIANSLPAILSPVPETPRMALAVTIDGGARREEIPGIGKLADRLVLKGTETRSAEELAKELDERAIDMRELTLADCSILLAVFLNRELPAVLEILEDVLFHSTFADFTKEAVRLEGEISSSLDMPAEIAQDLLIRAMFPQHPYGFTGTRILESLAEITEERTRNWYRDGLNTRRMNITLVGDFIPGDVLPLLEDTFADLQDRGPAPVSPALVNVTRDELVTRGKPDAQQAQVYQGWYAPRVGTPEQASTAVMNVILGGAGLSSRLFRELREKRGLAYSVRSSYTALRETGDLIASIGTSPENIERAQLGFAEQMARIQNEPVTEDELINAKGRLGGSFVLSHETTSQRCLDMAIAHINGLGPDYSTRMLERVQEVTIPDVQSAAQGIHSPSVTAIVAREDALPK
ncbi:MAG: M16 family metallopeptidase [Armatimonadota bacterium]